MQNDVRLVLYFGTGEGALAAPEGPGWYLYATRPTTQMGQTEEIIPHVRLPSSEAIQLAKVVDRFTQGKPLNYTSGAVQSNDSLEVAIATANEEAKALVQRELEEAQRQIHNLEVLKARAKEFGVDS